MTCPICSTEHARPAVTVHDFCPVAQDSIAVDPRWSVCEGGPSAWHDPAIRTDDPQEAIAVYRELVATIKRGEWRTVAIFDDGRGEGKPLSDDDLMEMLDL